VKRFSLALAFTIAALAVNARGPEKGHFVLIFRRKAGGLSLADQRKLTEQVGPWAAQQEAAGHHLDPHILGAQSLRIAPGHRRNLAPPSGDDKIGAIMFLEAKDFDEAVQVADSHPALEFGASVEVCPWSPPAASTK